LFQLAASEEITGIARGVAFQLVEALGVLDRRKVAEEVKGLDQPARATLRKFGVRFGAYSIYVPPLLKPAPRVLALQLWGLKQGDRGTAGLDQVERLAASGRTSIAADKEIDNTVYTVGGYRVCGERAVRVDMLERLADIIRPALAWRAGAPGVKPAAAFDGTGCFTVAVGMTSLVGCAGEDFAAILRSLGYRMEKRPKPPAPAPPEAEAPSSEAGALESPESPESPPVPAAAEPLAAVATEAATESATEAATEASPEPAGMVEPVAGPIGDPASGVVSDLAPALAPDAETAASEAVSETASEAPALTDAVDLQAAEPEPIPAPPAEPVSDPSEPPPAADAAAATTDAAAEESQFVEVWRLGRPDGPRRHRRPPRARESRARPENPDRTGSRSPAATDAATATDAAASAPASEAMPGAGELADGAERRQDRRPRRHRPGRPDQSAAERGEQGRADQNRPDQGRRDQNRRDQNRPDRGDRPERHGRAERAGRNDRPERDPELRAKYLKGRGDGRDRRDKAPDPNSPFAKLAALKEQLEANAKEQR
jgi:ATP-dependent RNA helicase SUPV3L1/SUV3